MISTKLKSTMLPTLITTALLLGGCLYEPIHQGNRLQVEKVAQIDVGMTRFAVEQLLGSPMLDNTTHPQRVTYIEEFEADGEMVNRGIEIVYDDALRVQSVRRFGFDK